MRLSIRQGQRLGRSPRHHRPITRQSLRRVRCLGVQALNGAKLQNMAGMPAIDLIDFSQHIGANDSVNLVKPLLVGGGLAITSSRLGSIPLPLIHDRRRPRSSA